MSVSFPCMPEACRPVISKPILKNPMVLKLLYLALHQIAKKWTMPLRDWKPAMTQFMIMFGDRVSL